MKTKTIIDRARAKGLSDIGMSKLAKCGPENIRQARVRGREMSWEKVWPIYRWLEAQKDDSGS